MPRVLNHQETPIKTTAYTRMTKNFIKTGNTKCWSKYGGTGSLIQSYMRISGRNVPIWHS